MPNGLAGEYMNFTLEINNIKYHSDLSLGKSIAIDLLPNDEQPNHFGAPACTSKTLEMGSYIGDTKRGGSCNANVLTMIPHCNGTHTESVSHIIDELIPVYQCIENELFPSVLISIKPVSPKKTTDSYIPFMDQSNLVITQAQLEERLSGFSDEQLQGLVIRTLENDASKKNRIYNNKNYPPYFTNNAMRYLVERKIKHLMVDFPSVDKMYDDGKLSNHRLFWNIEEEQRKKNTASTLNKTITEMAYINNDIKDGFYLCNLQCPKIKTDAVPSAPVLYPLKNLVEK